MARVIRACLPVAGLTSHSRAASSPSVPVRVAVTRTTGDPIRVMGVFGDQVQAATPGSVVVFMTRHPLLVPGRPPLATGSVSTASGPGTGEGALVTVAGPGAIRYTWLVWSAANDAAW